MILRWRVRSNTYHDSIKLMRLSESLSGRPGVLRAAAVMATPMNVELLAGDQLLPEELRITPDDLLITVLAQDEALAEAALDGVDDLLASRSESGSLEEHVPATLEQATATSNLAVIAVPGAYAATEGFAALRAGLHVFLFSDNVSLDDEIRLKALGAQRELLVMGPDCGTAIIDGVGLGFANRVASGPVGIVGASGTGIQQVCCLLDEAGLGVAQAIGTGGRDLSAEVGGATTRQALQLLATDPAVQTIVLISKPPDPDAARRLHQELVTLGKTVIACLLGLVPADEGEVHYVRTLTDAARAVCNHHGIAADGLWPEAPFDRGHASFRSRVYGLFSGGTLCSEAGSVLDDLNVPHLLLDLGSDRYTQGRAHPMIDPRLRASAIPDVGRHDDAGALLLDVVLGDLAHPDPSGALLPALAELRSLARLPPPVLAVLVGTQRDPQGLAVQRRQLEAADVQVFTSNAAAARAAGILVGGSPS